jgi:hypothetical protein
MNIHDIIIDRSPAAKAAYIDKLREELKGMGLSVIETSVLAALIAEARRQGMLEHAI